MRAAALLPAATDIVIALGAGDQLVAVTHACTLPEGLEGIPRVTRSRVAVSGARDIDGQVSGLSAAGAPLFEIDELLLAAQTPDILLTQAVCDVCAVREADVRAAAARLIPPPRVATLGASTVEGILADCMAVARALGVAEEGEELVAGLRARIGRVHRRLQAANAPRADVLVLEWTDPPFSAGHWVPDAIRRAGGRDPFGETGKPSRRIEFAEVRGRDLSVVVVAPCGYSLEATRLEIDAGKSELFDWLRFRQAWLLDANRLLSSPGPNVVRGIEVLARILHPSLFGAPDARDAFQLRS